ncbi:12858_t:CDS:1 [Funneliformis caledonium]|uniref:12858_t:CDS:1 n=1 Tax=Funneliformis caledonium TaxID=1117310 RepID=A0A9N9BI97_9GLOM|nr:12858_t:CDS:1 [Funneliformis caledonium]
MGYWSKDKYMMWNPWDFPNPFPPNRSHGPNLQNITQNLYCLKMKLKTIEDVKCIPSETKRYLRWMLKAVCSCQHTNAIPNPIIRETLDIALSDILDNIIPQLELGNPPPFSCIPLNDDREIFMICQELQSDLEEYTEITDEFCGMPRLAMVLFTLYPNSK